MNLFRLIFGSKNDRDVKKIRPVVARINEVEAGLQKLSDDDLRAKTAAWKAELSQIEDKTELALKLGMKREHMLQQKVEKEGADQPSILP